jgi:hypothetical protein
MSDEHPPLPDLLETLHHELEHGPAIDDRTASLLRTVLADIEKLISPPAPPPAPEQHHSVAERLRETTWQLEETHPRLTSVIGQLLDALGRTIR